MIEYGQAGTDKFNFLHLFFLFFFVKFVFLLNLIHPNDSTYYLVMEERE